MRKGKVVVTGVSTGAKTALAELPVLVLPVLLIADTLQPTIALAAEAITTPEEQTAALNTASGSSDTYAWQSPAKVLAGQYWLNCFCLVTGLVKVQPKKIPTV
jgi:hypothetical protein